MRPSSAATRVAPFVVASVFVLLILGVLAAPTVAQAQEGYTETVCAQGKGGVTLTVEGRFIVLRGGLCPGDGEKFHELVKSLDPSVRTVKLVSGGGNAGAAQAIGDEIRARKLDTFVDAAHDRCASACTFIFAAGVQRFYAGASDIVTGFAATASGRRGLGFHYLDANHPSESDFDKLHKFNQSAVPYLNQMLPKAAAKAAIALMTGNHTTQMIWLNGDEALQSGIATSLASPPGR